MKKKLTSVIALAMAMALTFGMTVCAAGSSATPDVNADVTGEVQAAEITEPTDEAEVAALETEAAVYAKAITVEGATVATLTAGELKSAKESAQAIAARTVASNVVVTVLAGADIEAAPGTYTINFPGFVKAAGKQYMVLHYDEVAKVWETVDAEIQDGKVIATFKSLSPVVIVEMVEKVPAAVDTTATSPAESPKTGETLPVAGIMAVICLAGAVVCAKKARA